MLLFAYAWRGRIAAWVAAPYMLGTWFMIVYLADHYVVDIVAGAAYALIGWPLVPRLFRLDAAAAPARAVSVPARAPATPERRCPTLGAMSDDVRDLIIIGGARAGLTAALYAARANLAPLVIEGFEAGGQLMITSDVENYPGFPEGMIGPELMGRFREQAERFGTEFITDDVTRSTSPSSRSACTSARRCTARAR